VVDLALRELADAVVGSTPPPQPFGTYVLSSADPGAELGRAIERDVFLEFYGNTPELMAAEYGTYEPASVFLCVIDHRRVTPAGAIRMIVPSELGQKTFVDVERVWDVPTAQLFARGRRTPDLRRTWDISTLAVAPEYRGRGTEGLISLALYQATMQLAVACDVDWYVTVLDLVVLDLIQTRTYEPFSRFTGLEPMNYLDSPASLPVYMDVPEFRERVAAADDTMHALLFEGTGLEEVIANPDWTTSVDRAVSAVAGSAHL
jgi:hypothetical protein